MSARQRPRREVSAGGVVVRFVDHDPHFLLINDSYGNWGFPKGHVDSGETPEDAARREVEEETGLAELRLVEALGVIDWFFRFRGDRIHKFCHFFLFESQSGTPTPQREEGISECCWYPLSRATEIISYENSRNILRQAGRSVQNLCSG